ncbi:MAG: type II toxin-antitoxin system Phd/YefM family antitoxin [Thiomonas sp.]|uniref:type II toxin-antitoxin system Phd/YefM family antitoxin n=1 Tax=Thiomonas sp. TaxID=2047785 RepID=UPI002A35E805|nr:type II toxin-antitoxin system Phd/YefM family antitoxin [Thiomonas sp.]MDY0330941.1 type II toxin-antitoxin system Phd/YefM family antitoxin [Thiomonas sp.]
MSTITINMLDAKTHLSRLIQSLGEGREREIVIARNGQPVARLLPMDRTGAGKRLGVAKGRFVVPENIDAHDAEVAALFLGAEPS